MPHTDARDYFVSIIRGDSPATRRTGLLAGPFPTHTAALDMVEPTKAEAHRVDAWTDFDANCRRWWNQFGGMTHDSPTHRPAITPAP